MSRSHLCKEAKATAAGPPLLRPHSLCPHIPLLPEEGEARQSWHQHQPQGFLHGSSHHRAGAQDSPVLTFPPPERVAVLGNFVKSSNFFSI